MILRYNYTDDRGQTFFAGQHVPIADCAYLRTQWNGVTKKYTPRDPSVIFRYDRDDSANMNICQNSPRKCSRCDATMPLDDTGTICYDCKVTSKHPIFGKTSSTAHIR